MLFGNNNGRTHRRMHFTSAFCLLLRTRNLNLLNARILNWSSGPKLRPPIELKKGAPRHIKINK